MSKYHQDEQWMKTIAAGDRTLLKELYLRFREPFLAFIQRHFQCTPQRATDIYPEAFSRFYFAIEEKKLQPPLKSSLKTYLFTVGKNLYHKRYLDAYHKKKSMEEQIPDRGSRPEAEAWLESEDNTHIVAELLAALDATCQRLLKLYFWKNYSAEAIGRELGIATPGAVRKRRFDCIKKMRRLLRERK